MKVLVDSKEIELIGKTVSDALRQAGINPETVLVSIGGRLVSDMHEPQEGDDMRTMKVISGG